MLKVLDSRAELSDHPPPGKEALMGNEKLGKAERLQDYEKYYRSCYRWAKFFDLIDMAWVYCPDSDREGELDKVTDFYLPDQDSYFNVGTWRPGRGRVDYGKLSDKCEKLIVIGYDQGGFHVFEHGHHYPPSDSLMCRCTECGRFYFLNAPGTYVCRVCGAYDGDHHLARMIFGNECLFEMIER